MVGSGCSPYEEVLPLSKKLSESIEPSEDSVWKVTLLPGTDNSFHQANVVPPCFDEARKIEYLRELDRLAFIDVGKFEITLLITRRENVSGFKAWPNILSILRELSQVKSKAEFEKLSAKISRSELVSILASIDLNSVQRIELLSELKALDRNSLGLYTGVSDGLVGKTAFWLVNKKTLREALDCLSSMSLEAKQQIFQKSSGRCLSSTWFGFLLEGGSSLKASDAVYSESEKPFSEKAVIKSTGAVGFNYNLYGYNLGVYS